MRKIGKSLLRLALILVGIVLLGAIGYFAYQYWQDLEIMHNRPATVLAKDGTNINPSWYHLTTYQRRLREKYPYIYKLSFYSAAQTYTGQGTVIPGLTATRSYDFSRKKVNTAKMMTPQGVTLAGPYILLTAYDGEHHHASVIYVLKRDGQYLKTIQVPGRPHLGGITYDPKAKEIWLTDSLNGRSALSSFSLARLKKWPVNSSRPLIYDQRIELSKIQKASTVTYYDNQLFVGYFNMYGHGKITSYTITRSGANANTITNNEVKAITGSQSWSDPNGQAAMNKQIQGIAFYQDKIFLSQSYGSADSKLYIFPITAVNNLDEKNAERVIDLPPYLEQVLAYKGQLICLFESASQKYGRPNIMVMDRLLSVNINALFGD
jgi:hypothetical protein